MFIIRLIFFYYGHNISKQKISYIVIDM